MRIKGQSTIFKKMCTIFIGLIMIVFLLSYGLYSWGAEKIKEQMIDNLCMQNDQFANIFSREIERITLLQYELTNDWDLTKLSLMYNDCTEYQKSEMMINIRDKISPVQGSSKLIEDIKIIVPAINKYIGTKTISNIPDDMQQLVKNYENIVPKQLIYEKGKWMIIAEYPTLYYKIGKDVQFLIQTTLSEKAIGDYLASFNTEKNSKGFLLSPSKNLILCSDYNKEEVEKIADALINNEGKELSYKSQTQWNTQTQMIKIGGIRYITVYTNTNLQDIKIVKFVEEKQIFEELIKYKRILYACMILAIGVVVIFAYYMHRMIHAPLQQLMNGFKMVQNGNLDIKIEHKRDDEFKYIYQGFNETIRQLDELINQYYKQRLLAQNAELKQLQAQINPHFLYNSFIILSNRIRAGDNAFASEFCSELASFFRFITKNKNNLTTLKEEVEHAYVYSKIQYARFSNRMTMQLDPLPEVFEKIEIPRLVLQPIIENTFLYALEVIDYKGFLHVGYKESAEFLDIIIEDNGDGLTEERLIKMKQMLLEDDVIETTGIINIHRRLQLSFSKQCGLIVERSEYGGLKTTVRILMAGEKTNGKIIDC